MKLPNADRAIVNIAKVRDYCLNPFHPYGRHKARVFKSALGFDQRHADDLCQILRRIAMDGEAELDLWDDYGQRYVIDFDLPGLTRMVRVRSCWMVLQGQDVPRLTSCYVLTRSDND